MGALSRFPFLRGPPCLWLHAGAVDMCGCVLLQSPRTFCGLMSDSCPRSVVRWVLVLPLLRLPGDARRVGYKAG